ncbi:uncharacterized protein LOC135483968 [Lineus longissimus]|uniref:uncharacterized protein LOC135483968 n=1 Tax=Lineus longissimus TaxID=88925 RepID=UPI00315DAC2D
MIDGQASAKGWHTYVLEDIPLTDGFVCTFEVFIKNTGPVLLQVWRADPVATAANAGAKHFSLVGQLEYNALVTGEQSVQLGDPIAVKAGDHIGFMNIADEAGSVAYNFGAQFSLNRDLQDPSEQVIPSVGDIMDIDVFVPSYIYSLGTRVSTDRSLCFPTTPCPYTPRPTTPTTKVDVPTTQAPTPVVTGAPQPKTTGLPRAVVTTGNPIIPGRATKKETDIHILLDYSFELPYGVVCYFDTFMADTLPTNFQIWRRNATSVEPNVFTLTDETTYSVDEANKAVRVWVANRTVNGVYTPIRFKEGDYFGFTSILQDSVGYNFGGNVPGSRTLFRKLNTNEVPKPGDNYEINVKFLVYKFSLSVTYATHVDLCYDGTTMAPKPTDAVTMPPVRTTPAVTPDPGTPGPTSKVTDGAGAVYKIGNPSLPGVTMKDGIYSVVFDTFDLLQGYLCFFEGYFTELHHTHLQIWRPQSTDPRDRSFQLVTNMNFTPSTVPGVNRAYPGENDNIRLFANDRFGFTTDEKSVLAFRFGQYAWTLQASMDKIPVVDGVYDINVRFHPYNISLSVTVATRQEWCDMVPTTVAPVNPTIPTEAPNKSTQPPVSTPSAAPGATTKIGNDVDMEPKLPGIEGNNSVVMDGFNLTDGYLYKFNVVLNSTDPVTFQIFRPDPVDPNILNVVYEIGPFRAPYAPGVFEIYANPPAGAGRRRRRATAGVLVKAGDKMGFTVSGGNPMASTSGGTGSGIIVVPATGNGAINLSNGLKGSGSYIMNVEISQVPLEIPTTTAAPTTALPATTETPTTPPSTAVNLKYVGNDVLSGGVPVFDMNRIYILQGYDLPAGWVYRFEMHLSTVDPIKLQIWRPNALKPSEVSLVGEMDFYAKDGGGLYSAYPNETNAIAVQAGDKLGFATVGNNPLHIRQEQDAGSYVGILDLNVIGRYPAVGEPFTLTGISFSDKFPLAIEISSSYIPPPSETPLTIVTKGNGLTNGTQGPDGTSTYILDQDLKDGYVYKYNVFLATTDPVRLQVFRPLGGTSYRLLGEVETLARYGPGEYRIYPSPHSPIAVKTTDRIGFTTIVTNPLTYKITSDATVNTIKNLASTPSVGDTVSTTGVDFVFEWALNVEIASSYLDPPIGQMGEMGADGPDGPQGQQGEQGSQGVKGEAGDAGLEGPRGTTGDQGVVGEQGLLGDVGDVGMTGSEGAPGNQGDLGARGVTGGEGSAGLIGNNGPRGVTGAQGVMGLTGYEGVVGPLGVGGSAGNQGDQGPAGQQGPKGDVGDVGPVQSVSCAVSGCQHVCTELVGAVECSCNPGYLLQDDKKTCADINECNTYNGMCQQNCVNDVPGSATCTCKNGYNVSPNGRHCDDLNECLKNPCSNDEVCLNTEGSYACYKGTGSSVFYNEQGNTAALATTTTFLNRNVFIGLIVWMILVSLGSLLVAVAMMFKGSKKKDMNKKMQMQQSMRRQSVKRHNPDYALPEFTEIYDR